MAVRPGWTNAHRTGARELLTPGGGGVGSGHRSPPDDRAFLLRTTMSEAGAARDPRDYCDTGNDLSCGGSSRQIVLLRNFHPCIARP